MDLTVLALSFLIFIVVTGRILEIKREPTIKGRDVSYDPQIFEFLFLIFCIPNETGFTGNKIKKELLRE